MMYPEKTILVCCQGLFVSLAERLARDFGKVYLNVPLSGSFPQMNHGMLGYGLPGVELVDDVFGEHFDEVDLFMFPDLGQAAVQCHLESLGKRVWGGRMGEEMEQYREFCKECMQKEGLPVQPYKVLKGVKALRAHLKATPDQHVKINHWRGVTESFFSPNYDVVETKIDQIAHALGAFQEILEFIVEDDLPDRVEAGIDAYCIDGQYPAQTLAGIEVKDLGYVGQMVSWDAIPEPVRRWNDRMAHYWAQYGYRGFMSNEVRIGKDKVPYMIDATCRAPSPPSELWQELYTNLSEIIWEGADGVMVDPVPAAKWGVEIIIKSAWAKDNWQPVRYPPEFARNIKLFNCVEVDGVRYVVPQGEDMQEIGAVVGWGDSLAAAVEMATEAGESIQAYGVKFGVGPIDAATKQIEELDALGVSPFEMDSASQTT